MYDHYHFYPYYSSAEVDYLSDLMAYYPPISHREYLEEVARQKDITSLYPTQKQPLVNQSNKKSIHTSRRSSVSYSRKTDTVIDELSSERFRTEQFGGQQGTRDKSKKEETKKYQKIAQESNKMREKIEAELQYLEARRMQYLLMDEAAYILMVQQQLSQSYL